jgi:hypothetical protein
MKRRTPVKVAMATLLLGSLLSCHKESDIAPNAVTLGSITQNDTAFDWENAQYMPAAPGYYVRMPWASGGGSTLDISVASDYHQTDGWDMVYNTFGNTVNPTVSSQSPLYFALYNRYRGILRYYFYNPGYSNYSTQLEHGLALAPNTSSSTMLNFEGHAIVDALASNNVKGFTQTSKVLLNSTSTWYVMQYQIAYDPYYTTYSFEAFHPHWNVKNVNITSIKTDGQEFGNINGSITTPAAGIDWPSVAANAIVGAAEVVGIVTGAGWEEAAQGGLLSNATGILSGLFGGNSSNDQEVALTIDSKITTTGSAVSNGGIADVNFWLPGQTSTTPANAPAQPIVNYPIGLFNLPDRPVVRRDYSGDGIPHSNQLNDFYFTYTVDANAIKNSLQKNPSVFNTDPSGATLTNFNATVIALNLPSNWDADGTRETVGANTLYSGNPLTGHYQSYAYRGVAAGTIAVRVSFNVEPNTPNPARHPIFVVKTFLASIQ